MSSGVSGVSGAGGVGGVAAGGSSAPSQSSSTAKVNASPGANSVGKGKGATVVEGDGNMVGNSQTQNITNNEYYNNYGMSTRDFCSLRDVGSNKQIYQSGIRQGPEIDVEALQKMMMIMMIMKMLESFMDNSAGSKQQGGFSGIM